MPARKHSKSKEGNWKLMLRADVRDREVERIKRDHPDASRVLDHLATVMKEYENHGWTVFSDWLDAVVPKAVRNNWTESLPRISIDTLRQAVFPAIVRH